MQRQWHDPEDAALAAIIFGTGDFIVVSQQMEHWVRTQSLGNSKLLSIELSVGAAATLALDGGRKIFVKVWPSPDDPNSLAAQIKVQRQMQLAGFPAPAVLSALKPLGSGVAVAMEYTDTGDTINGRQPGARRAMAQMLFRLISEAEQLQATPGLPSFTYPSMAKIWPKPHNALFDFNITAAGAEWIDDVARASLHALQQPVGRRVLGHNDWSAQNLRWHADAISMVYDWDSVFLGPETTFLGTAAANFPASWQPADIGQPTHDDMQAFVADYAEARGKNFNIEELAEIAASINYTRAYTARCEHASDPAANTWQGSAREALRLHGPVRFLSLSC